MKRRYLNLVKEIALRRPQTIMEIGTWDARHASDMIREAQKHHKVITYHGFDIFEGIDKDVREKELHVKRIIREGDARKVLGGLGAEIHLYVGYTTDTLPEFKPDAPIDFVYIDGGHSLETIENDWRYVSRLMNSETVVVFDDYYSGVSSEGCLVTIEAIKNNPIYKVEHLHPIDSSNSGRTIQLIKVTKVR